MTSTTPSPFRPRPPKPSSPSPYLTTTTAAPSLLHTFTPAMRDRQARGKDPYRSSSSNSSNPGGQHSSDDDDDDDYDVRRVLAGSGSGSGSKMRVGGAGGGGGVGGRVEKLDYSRVERRQKAVAFLESPELLMMWAQSQGDVSPPPPPNPPPLRVGADGRQSVASARLHFTRMLCGYEKPEGGGGKSKVAGGGVGVGSGGRKSLGREGLAQVAQGGGGGSGGKAGGSRKEGEKRRERARG